MSRETVRNTVEDAAQAARTLGTEALRAARIEIGSALDKAKDAAMAEAEVRAEAGRDFVADQARDLASRLRTDAASEDAAIRMRLLDMLAVGTTALADDFQRQSLSSLLAQTEDFARRNPGAFIAGAALAGFAATRLARASDPTSMTEGDRAF